MFELSDCFADGVGKFEYVVEMDVGCEVVGELLFFCGEIVEGGLVGVSDEVFAYHTEGVVEVVFECFTVFAGCFCDEAHVGCGASPAGAHEGFEELEIFVVGG